MIQSRIVVGVIGCGMVADLHISNLNSMRSVFVKWLCDVNEKTLKRSLIKHNISSGTRESCDVIDDPTVDAVIICTPPNSHYRIAKCAILNNKHVLVEKPIAIDRKEVKQLFELANNNSSLIIMDASARHSRLQPKFTHIKNIIGSGMIGEIYHIHHSAICNKSRPGIEYHPDAKWFLDKNISGGGPLIDWGVYDLSFHLGLLDDKPELLKLKSTTHAGLDDVFLLEEKFTVEEHGIVFMELSEGLTYYWERATNAHNDESNITKIYGTKGGIMCSYPIWESNKINIYNLNNKKICRSYDIPLLGHLSDEDDHFELDHHFIECILTKSKPILPFSIATKHMNIIMDSYEYTLKT